MSSQRRNMGHDASEADFRQIVDRIPGFVCTLTQTGEVEFANQRILDFMGMTLDEIRGRPLALHEEDRERVESEWNRAVESGLPYDVEHRIRGADGVFRWFHVRGVGLPAAPGSTVWYLLLTDIEDRKRADEARTEGERSLRRLIESIPGMIAVSDGDGGLEYLNERILKFVGRDLAELRKLGWASVVHEDDVDSVLDAWRRSRHTGQPIDVTFRMRRADGAHRWFHSRSTPLLDGERRIRRWYSLLWDIEDRKQAELALQASERELRLLIDSVPGMVAVASATGEHEYANKRVMDYVGRSLSDVAGMGWTDDIHPGERDAVRKEWLRCVERGQAMDIDHRWRRHDGVYRWFHARVEPLLDARGGIVRWYGLLVDIDDWKRTEEALRRSQADLAHVTRLTTMGELSASIAHEVNQPLAAIVNNADACLGLLSNGAADLADVREALHDIAADAERASAVIERVRQLAKRAPVVSALLDLRQVVGDVVRLAGHESASRGVAIRTELAQELPPVRGDLVQLQQVLLNLVVNGIDAMGALAESERVLTISAHRDGGDAGPAAVLAVRDAGVGFTADAADHLFDAFFTTKPHGMGMGLAISRSIIEAHGGRLWAESHPGPGATFAFRLPAAAPDASDRE